MVGVTEGESLGASPAPERPDPGEPIGEREWARKQVERKHKLRADLMAYLLINAFLVGAWAATGLGYFWPGWVLGAWGVFLLLDAWTVYHRRPVTEEEIERELRSRR